MAKYSAVKATVNAYIKQNGRKEITGRILNAVLNATIDSLGKYFQFAGGALPTDDPGTPDQNVCYLAGEPGVYTNFGGITIENEEVALLFWDGEWTKQRILIGIREVNASVDNQVGTPSVDVSYSGGRLVLTFHNIKGEQGETGKSAGFGTIGADINGGVGTPGVSVETSGSNLEKNIMFHFTNLKGETGVTSVVATIDDTSGTPSCQVSLVNGVLTLAFSGLKGLKGDTGVSADYPITIYNGLDSDATDQALAAAQGKVLDGKISQLGQYVADLDASIFSGEVTKDNLVWSNGYINTAGKIASSSASKYTQPFLLRKGQMVSVTTNNSNITIIGTTTSPSITAGDVITPIQTTSSSGNFETHEYTATEDIMIVVCVRWEGHTLSFTYPNPINNQLQTAKMRLYGALSGEGADSAIVKIEEIHLVAGEKYRITIPTWSHSSYGSSVYVLGIYYRPYGASANTMIVQYSGTSNIPSYYDITAVDAEYYGIYFRAASGTDLQFGIFHKQDITLDDVNGLSGYLPIRLLNNYFVGQGNTYATKAIYGLKGGYKYRMIIKNTSWDKTGVTSTNVTALGIASYHNNVSTSLLSVSINSQGVFPTIKDYYDFTIPSDSDYVVIGGRATSGEQVEFMIAYNSLVPIVENSFNSALHSGLTDWKTPCQRFSALMAGDSLNDVPAVDKCDAFVFFTDPHTQANNTGWADHFEEYLAQLQKVYNSTPTEFVLCGGDWLGNSDTPEQAAFKLGLVAKSCYTMMPKCYLLVGNHDTNYQGKKDSESATYTTKLPNDSIRNLWYYWNNDKAYFTIESRNTKFYCFDTGVESQPLAADNDYGYEQAEWFAQSILSDSSEHIAVALHIYRPSNNSETLQPLAQIVMQIAVAYNSRGSIVVNSNTYDFSAVSGKVEFAIAGHQHTDAVYTYSASGVSIPVIVTIDTGNVTTFPQDASFDLVFVDYDNRKITCVRVGSGADREINLS